MSNPERYVLIVDDERANISALVELLKNDYQLLIAKNGEQALRRAAGDPRPDIVLLDVLMPGMDGHEVCRRLKADPKTAEIPVIFVTVKREVGSETEGFALGAVDYITKPISPPVVKARIKTHLENKEARAFAENRNAILEQMVSERTRELAGALLEAQAASRAKSEFLANISHELRTPLNAILGFSEVILHGIMPPDRIGGCVESIRQSGSDLLRIVNDILDLSKLDVGRLELTEDAVSIRELAEAACRAIAPSAKRGEIALVTALPRTLPLVRVDAGRFQHILRHLLSNAVKFTPPGGRITLSIDRDADGGLALTVSDTGIGMSEEEIAIAIEPFRQVDSSLSRRYGGMGLGLPLAKAFTELHGGQLEIKSAPKAGTAVCVHLPAERIAEDLADSTILPSESSAA